MRKTLGNVSAAMAHPKDISMKRAEDGWHSGTHNGGGGHGSRWCLGGVLQWEGKEEWGEARILPKREGGKRHTVEA
jgi:hypothetical protein